MTDLGNGEATQIGPYVFIKSIIKSNSKIIIETTNNRKYHGYLRIFDRYCNLIIEDVTEMWIEKKNTGSDNSTSLSLVSLEKYYPRLFIRGDSVILISKIIQK
uniref:Small nuclear ribonucleoprotein Sm D2 n=1 Tax=Amorphochlora amoebiformis TaxID=1561963 RepID=A0A0H5BI38_9EUKA|nr:mRNA splicing factor [Amorphochlora amoebiformis]|mmetsp:Transcript_2685/g.4009  ORF Transcript_2685/g.4009 Transcript_2685/m.4009 type:complete len:103 (-) Transcript_2685:250-558(-)